MKKTLSILLATVLLLSIGTGISIFALANDKTNDFEYYIMEDGTASISGYTGLAKDIVIPSEIDGYTVTEIGRWSFMNNNKIESVVIPESIKTIRMNAFLGCDLLTSITIPGNVKEIDYSAFQCKNLENVVLCNGVEYVGQWAFAGSKIKNIVIPESVTKIGLEAFSGCDELKYAVILNPNCEIIESFVTPDGDRGNLPLKDFRIYGYTGSTAQTYAAEWGYEFINIKNVIMDGTDAEYTTGSSKGVTIHCLYDLKNLVSITMDDVTVDPANYTLAEGSTILTFSPAYLDTLPAGEHTVTLNYKNATATAMLTILADPNEPTTDPDPDEPATEPGEPATKPSEPITEPGTPTTPGEPTGGTPSDDDIPTSAVDSVSSTENAVKTDAATKSPDTGAQPAALTFAVLLAASVGLSALLYTQKRKRCV